MFFKADETGRITSSTGFEEFADGMQSFDFPEEFDFSKQYEYRIVNGELIHDPVPPSEEEIAAQKAARIKEQAQAATVMLVRAQAASLTDEQALSVPDLFEEWAANREYAAGAVLSHSDGLYRVAQSHTSQEQWKPGETGTEALYTRISFDPETGVEDWKQPTGAHDAYAMGAEVMHDGQVWVSDYDGNVWEPGVFGWHLRGGE